MESVAVTNLTKSDMNAAQQGEQTEFQLEPALDPKLAFAIEVNRLIQSICTPESVTQSYDRTMPNLPA